jgi:hypothetical protein
MDKTTGAAIVAGAGAIWQEPCGAEGSFGLNSRQQLIIPCPREVSGLYFTSIALLPWRIIFYFSRRHL